MTREKAATFYCTLEATLAIIAGKYKALIIWQLANRGPQRFSQLQRELPRATPKMLSQQLREMADDGLVHRKLYPVVPPHTEYSLTPMGNSIVPIINAMCAWGEDYFESMGLLSPDRQE